MKITKNGTMVTVEHEEGDRYVFNANGRVTRPSNGLFRIKLDTVWELEKLLGQNRPDFKAALVAAKEEGALDAIERNTTRFLDFVEHTTRYASYDSYKGEATWRVQPLPFENCPAIMSSEPELIRELAEKHGIPCTKAFFRLYLKSYSYMKAVIQLKVDWGIQDPNNILKLVPDCTVNYCDEVIGRDEGSIMAPTVKLLTEVIGENTAATVLSKPEERSSLSYFHYVSDRYEVPEKVLKWIFSETTNMHDACNTVVDYVNNAQLENVEFSYTEQEKAFEGVYGNIEFKLPVDARDLAVVGASMGICVGGYTGFIEDRKSLIVIGYDGEIPVVCVDVHNGCIQQMRGRFNYNVSEKYRGAIDAWLNATGIDPDCWYSFGDGNVPENHGNWAVIHPEQYDGYKLKIVKTRENLWLNYDLMEHEELE